MSLAESLRQKTEDLSRLTKQHKLQTALIVSLAVAGVSYGAYRAYEALFPEAGFCSEIKNLTPHLTRIPDSYIFNADNTNGGLLQAPIRSLHATEAGILVGHASPKGAPDSDNPVNPVRLLTDKGWELCLSEEEPIVGSVNSVFQNPVTKEIVVAKDTKDLEGGVVSIFNGRRWKTSKAIQQVLDHRCYDIAANGVETWVATYEGISVLKENKVWERLKIVDSTAMHAALVTKDQKEAVFGFLNRGISIYPKSKNNSYPNVPQKVRDIEESPDEKSIWVGGEEGLALYDRITQDWSIVNLPPGVSGIMDLEFNLQNSLLCFASFRDGTFCWDGTTFNKIDSNPALSLAFGQPNTSLHGRLYIGTPDGQLIQRLAS
jgi:hypothetical protein